jgi:hypothetical protein
LQFVDRKMTKKILKQARVQQQQLEDEMEEEEDDDEGDQRRSSKGKKKSSGGRSTSKPVSLGGSGEGDSDDEDEEELNHVPSEDEDDQGNFAKEIVRFDKFILNSKGILYTMYVFVKLDFCL